MFKIRIKNDLENSLLIRNRVNTAQHINLQKQNKTVKKKQPHNDSNISV